MIKKLMARLGFIHHTDVDRLMADLRNATHAMAQEQRRLQVFAEKLTNQHLAMHATLVEAEKGLANSQEEVRHLKSILAEERERAMSLVTQAVTDMSPTVTQPVPNLL